MIKPTTCEGLVAERITKKTMNKKVMNRQMGDQ
jgi:hypothetical protein